MSCSQPLAFDRLVGYWLGELAAKEEAALEEHFFACGHCAGQLETLARLALGIRAAFAEGEVTAAVSAAFLEAMKAKGLRVREYPLRPGAAVSCSLAGADAVVGRLAADLAGVARLDLVVRRADGGEQRLADIPFDPAAGEVLFSPSARRLEELGSFSSRVRLVSVGETGDTVLGEYTFNHGAA